MVLTFCGPQIAEALGVDVRDFGQDHGHRVLKVTRKGGKTARTPLPPPVVRAEDLPRPPHHRPALHHRRRRAPLGLPTGHEQLGRLCARAELPAGVSPHSLRHSYATEALRLGAALRDVQDALGHADPHTTSRYERPEATWIVPPTT